MAEVDIGTGKAGAGSHCPLCGHDRWSERRSQQVEPIRQYWAMFGFKLEEEYGVLPETLIERRCLGCGLHYFSPTVIGPARLYEQLSRQPWYYAENKWEFEEALKFIAELRPSRLLEVGCGIGAFLKQAARIGISVQGIEHNSEAIGACRRIGLNVSSDLIGELKDQFDVIASFQVIEHVENPGQLLEGCIERLRPGGHLILAVPNHDGVLKELQNDFLNLPPHHASLWEESSLRYVADHHGLAMVRYICEPLSFELYATYSQSLLARIPSRRGAIGTLTRKFASLVHRGLMPFFYEAAAQRLRGHTHVAIYRKPE